MNDSALTRFFAVVTRSRTWLGVLFHLLAFPLGLFYFVFLVTGISVGVGLVVVWIGIPILLVVAGAWWLFAAFERIQAHHLLGAELPPAPRPWERADGVWGKLKAHFGSGSTWLDLAYLIAKLAFGTVSFVLLVALAASVGWLLAMPILSVFDVPVVNGTWVPPLWLGFLCLPLGVILFFVSLHVVNAWSWVCGRWAEVMLRGPAQAVPWSPSGPLPPPEPLSPPPPGPPAAGTPGDLARGAAPAPEAFGSARADTPPVPVVPGDEKTS